MRKKIESSLKKVIYKDNTGDSFIRRIPYEAELTERARELRRNMTKTEKKIWFEILADKRFKNLRWLRQRPIGGFIVDFYCPQLKLVVEIDGGSHNEKIAYDDARSKYLESFGLKVIRFQNDYVMKNIEGVFRTLEQMVKDEIKSNQSSADSR